jgi:tetratricopeptide (TPR) repeat protein
MMMCREMPPKVTKLEPIFASRVEHAEDWFAWGQQLIEQEKYPKALLAFHRVVMLSPRHTQGWYQLGWLWGVLGQYESSIRTLDRVLAIAPDYAPAWYHRGLAFYYLSLPQESMASLERAVKCDPSLVAAAELLQVLQGGNARQDFPRMTNQSDLT